MMMIGIGTPISQSSIERIEFPERLSGHVIHETAKGFRHHIWPWLRNEGRANTLERCHPWGSAAMSSAAFDTETVAVVSDEPPRFSWSAAFAGAIVAAGVTFLLLTLGSGIGLSLVTVRHATATGAFLTLGAVYFLAAQAFGFAVGGHVVGRLIGPALETSREEDFRAGAHGLVTWALAVVVTAAIVALSALVAGSAAISGAVTAASTPSSGTHTDQAAMTSYWVDKLFRPDVNVHAASLAWRQYAQADTGPSTDMPPSSEQPTQIAPGDTQTPPSDNAPPPNVTYGARDYFSGRATGVAPLAPINAAPLPTLRPLGADKAEAGRILTVGMAKGELLSEEDRVQLAQLVSLDTGLSMAAARHRVDDVAQRIHDDEVATAETARKAAAAISLWTAFALLFGAVVAVFAAVSARWEDDREQGLIPGTRVVETRF